MSTKISPAQLADIFESTPTSIQRDFFAEHVSDETLSIAIAQFSKRTGITLENAIELLKMIALFKRTGMSQETKRHLFSLACSDDLTWEMLQSTKPLFDNKSDTLNNILRYFDEENT